MECKKLILVIIPLILSLVIGSNQYNILVIFPHSGKSHYMVYEPLLKQLANIGHNITVISSFPQKYPIMRFRDIDLNDGMESPREQIGINEVTHSRVEKYLRAHQLYLFADYSCQRGLKSTNLKRFLAEENKFDLMIIELWNTNCFLGLARKYNVKILGVSTCYPPPWVYKWIGAPENPSYIPNVFMDYSDHMTFWQRLENTLATAYVNLYFEYRLKVLGNEYSKKYLGLDVLEGGDIFYNVSAILTNTHFSLHRPRPLVPGHIEVGGIHIAETKKLPKEIEKYINESTHGVVYMSMGSMLQGYTFPKDKKDAFLRAFARLQQRVIWKWENETMEDKPDNVMIYKWTPQKDILCHPNVKVFISHGGLLGSLEAVHCGIPMIVLPQYGDQHINAKALEVGGGGVVLNFKDITEERISNALRHVLKPKFREQMKKFSNIFNDRPLSPMDTAIYWVEYLARHKNVSHLRSAAVEMPFYKYYLLDVAIFLITVIFIFFYSIYMLFKYIFQTFSTNKIYVKQKTT